MLLLLGYSNVGENDMSTKKIFEEDEIYNQLKNKDIFFIFSEDKELKDLEKIKIVNKKNKDEMSAKITSKAFFDDIDSAFEVIPVNMFWLKSEEEIRRYFKKRYSDRKVIVYRVNVENDNLFKCEDDKLKELIDESTLFPITNGHSVCEVYSVTTKDGRECILKIQRLDAIFGIDKEYEKLKWLEGRVRCPKVYYYNEIGRLKVLLRENFVGRPLFEVDNFGEDLGKFLKKLHSISITSCPFESEKVEHLVNRVNKNLHGLIGGIREEYPNETVESISDFMEKTELADDAVVHGDCSLPNILINDKGEMCFIDVGDLSISTKYYDLYYLVMSLKMNNKMHEFEGFCKAYGIKELDDAGMKFMEIVDKTFY